MTKPTQRSWWSRHWKWVVPVGCLTPVLVCGGVSTLVIVMAFGMIKSIGPYADSLAMVKSNHRAQQILGVPIEPGFLVGGNVESSGSSGKADIYYSVAGPKGDGTVYVVANMQSNQWTITSADLELDQHNERVDLLVNEQLPDVSENPISDTSSE